jgi:hypothetical protein
MRQRSATGLIVMVVVFGALGAGVAGQVSPPSAPAAPKTPPVARSPKAAPAPQRPHAPGDVEVEPITCWWKTDRNAVNVGERFTVTLTCSIVETNAIKMVPDLNQLEPTTVALPPFEVVKGVRHQDIRTPPWRYIQYEYTARVVGDAFFGKDVDIPGVKVTYRLQSSVGGASQGREQTYVLPALPMRVNSLVPKKTADIRDTSPDTFADIEGRRLRSNGELVAAAICFGFALVLIGLALVRVVGRYRVRTPAAIRPLPLGFVLRGCLRAASEVKADVARDGWTGEHAGRALTVFRIASAVALGRPVTQDIVDMNVAAREGQLALRKGILRRKHAMVSTSTTPGTIARTLSHAHGSGTSPRTQLLLADLQESMVVLRAARYGRNGQLDTTALDAALENGTSALKKLRVAKLWPMRTAGALAKSAADVGGMVWSR